MFTFQHISFAMKKKKALNQEAGKTEVEKLLMLKKERSNHKKIYNRDFILSVHRYTHSVQPQQQNPSLIQMSALTQIRAQPRLLSATPFRRVYLETCHKSRAFGEAGVGLVLVQEVSPAPMIICGLVSARLPTKRVQTTTGWLQLWPHSLQITQGLLFCRRKCLYNIKLFS